MFQPAAFREDDLDAQLALVRPPAGAIGQPRRAGIDGRSAAVSGRCRTGADPVAGAPVARQRALAAAAVRGGMHGDFQGAEGYVSPGWYRASARPAKWCRHGITAWCSCMACRR